MHRMIFIMLCVLALAACEKKPLPVEGADALVDNPQRLQALREACKADHAAVGDAQCSAVAEATRRRFLSGGASPYAGDPVKRPAAVASEPESSAVKESP